MQKTDKDTITLIENILPTHTKNVRNSTEREITGKQFQHI